MTMEITGNAEIDAILSGTLIPPKPITEKEKILKEFNGNCNDINGLLNDIKILVAGKFTNINPKKTDWTKVAETDHVKETLNEIVGFLNNTEAE
jgi:hypothetical protein